MFDAMGLLAAPETPMRIESVREGPWTGRSADVSVTLDLMVHDLDLALRLMKAKPSGVAGDGKKRTWPHRRSHRSAARLRAARGSGLHF